MALFTTGTQKQCDSVKITYVCTIGSEIGTKEMDGLSAGYLDICL